MSERILSHYRELQLIGEGTYGVVTKAVDLRTGAFVAIKKVKMDLWEEGVSCSCLREITALKDLQHVNIVNLLEVVNTGRHLHLVFEFCDFDLQQYIAAQTDPIPPHIIRHILHQLLEALRYCHSHRLLHRDIKPGNVLMNENLQTKLGDFGLARAIRVPSLRFTPEVVTLWYRAPEVLLGLPTYTSAVDIWSVGAIFGEMVTNTTVFRGVSETDQLATIFATLGAPTEELWPGSSALPLPPSPLPSPAINIAETFRRIGPEGIDLLRLMLVYDEKTRITAEEALQHDFFR